MAKRSYPLSKVYGLLEPGPVVVLTTSHKGKSNVMPLSWHTMMEFEPPLVGCVVSGNTHGDSVDKFQTFGLTPVKAESWGHRSLRSAMPASNAKWSTRA